MQIYPSKYHPSLLHTSVKTNKNQNAPLHFKGKLEDDKAALAALERDLKSLKDRLQTVRQAVTTSGEVGGGVGQVGGVVTAGVGGGATGIAIMAATGVPQPAVVLPMGAMHAAAKGEFGKGTGKFVGEAIAITALSPAWVPMRLYEQYQQSQIDALKPKVAQANKTLRTLGLLEQKAKKAITTDELSKAHIDAFNAAGRSEYDELREKRGSLLAILEKIPGINRLIPNLERDPRPVLQQDLRNGDSNTKALALSRFYRAENEVLGGRYQQSPAIYAQYLQHPDSWVSAHALVGMVDEPAIRPAYYNQAIVSVTGPILWYHSGIGDLDHITAARESLGFVEFQRAANSRGVA